MAYEEYAESTWRYHNDIIKRCIKMVEDLDAHEADVMGVSCQEFASVLIKELRKTIHEKRN